MANIIGIDPGASGAIVVFRESGSIFVIKMPPTPNEILQFLKLHSVNSFCFIEKVQGLPGNGGSAMFNFGKGYGHLEMALLANKIPFETVTPQKWQPTYQLGTKGSQTTTEWKNKLKAKAEQLFPNQKVTLWNSDALLIAEYGRRILKTR